MKPIFFTDIVDDWSIGYLIDQIKSQKGDSEIYLSTPGGSINAAYDFAIYAQGINNGDSGKKIKMNLLSHADSSGTIMMLAVDAEHRSIVDESTMFFHEPRYGMMFDVTSTDAEKANEALILEEKRLADYYVKRIDGLTEEEANKLIKGEKTLTSSDMQEMGIVGEVKPNYEFAAFNKKTNLNNFNQNKNKMGLFTKKETINSAVTTDGKTLLFTGELKEGSEIAVANSEDKNFEGEYTIENKVYTIDAKNTVSEVKEVENNNSEVSEDALKAITEGVVSAVSEQLKAIEERMDKIENTSSSHKPEKKNVDSSAADSSQASISAKTRELAEQIMENKHKVK